MKAASLIIAVAVSIATLMTLSVDAKSENLSDVAELLHQLGLPKAAQKQDLEDYDDEGGDDIDDDSFADVMGRALLRSLMEDGEDGEESIMATVMKSDEKMAKAQFGFLRGIWNGIRGIFGGSRGRRIRQYARRGFCNTAN